MTYLRKTTFAASALALMATSAHALDEPKYLSAMGLGYFPDSVLELDDGYGARALVGLPLGSNLNLELGIVGYAADPEAGGPDLEQYGAGADLMIPFAKGNVTPFMVLGGGYLRAEAGNIERLDNGYANAGLGLLFDLGRGWGIRAEGRYVALFPDSKADIDEGHLDDAVAGLGLQYTFQRPEPPAPPPPPPPPVVVAPPADSDGDGVIDSADQCPNTPVGVQVDVRGCPLDGDGDGVPDYLDKCPNTTRGLKVDADGCVREAQTIVLQNVNFEFDKDTLTVDARTVLSGVAQGLMSQKDLKVEIAGHTDALGSDGYNQRLSDRRAASVKSYLISQGVHPTQLISRGYGESQPVASNETVEGQAQNRRVEFRVLSQPRAR
ncbi:OmpA family protein [Panacagrimonas sp.]|uniref:OmpA family protein n=1 Tax=Panacagrimonas sp. TaxID=2480088 RepID=UPI003B52202C